MATAPKRKTTTKEMTDAVESAKRDAAKAAAKAKPRKPRKPRASPIPRNWNFEDSRVAAAFDRHVREQLPWYDLATDAISVIVRHYLRQGGKMYDIGASTGNIGRACLETIVDRGVGLIGIEKSEAMAKLWKGHGDIVCADAVGYPYRPFDVAVCFLVLMFLSPSEQEHLISRLIEKCRRGGAIIVFDKMVNPGGYFGTVMSRLTLAGKVAANVPSDEVIAKELSLSGVQRPVQPTLLLTRGFRRFFAYGEFSGFIFEKNREDPAMAMAEIKQAQDEEDLRNGKSEIL